MKVRVLVSFNEMEAGDVGNVSEDGLTLARGYIAAGLLEEVIEDGTGKAGQGRSASRLPRRKPKGADAAGTAGGEQGQGFGSGGYGSAESSD